MMMSEEINLERTEIGGYVTLIPEGRVMYPKRDYERLMAETQKLREQIIELRYNLELLKGNNNG
jgi:hypothetical protein